MGKLYVGPGFSALFEQKEKPSQVRIVSNYSFEDLRNPPAVVVGAFNNRWTMQMTSNLRFVFTEQDGHFRIQEQGPAGLSGPLGQGPGGEDVQDFAVVTPLLDAKTGQGVVAAAGVGATGTSAPGGL